MKKIYILFCTICSLLAFSQGENDNWYFGSNAAVNFTGSNSLILNNSVMQQQEAVGSISDKNGNLLFYTNGETIWGRNHHPIFNGTGLLGNNSSAQLAISKHPGNPNQFFVFTTGINPGPGNNTVGNPISYSIVDMSQGNLDANGNPLGEVLDNFKNIPLFGNRTMFREEAITVVGGANNDFWVLIPHDDNLYSFNINSSGIMYNPVISPLLPNPNLQFPIYFTIKASEKLIGYNFSNYICISHFWQGQANTVYSFDNATGMVTPQYSLQVNSQSSYIPEFNKDGSVLYLAYQNLFAVDLLSSSSSNLNLIQVANLNIPNNDQIGAVQRNRNGKIYISNIFNPNFLGEIINPDIYGSQIGYNANSIYLGGNPHFARIGLPQLVPDLSSECTSDITLSFPETNNNSYQVSNSITTQNNYAVSSGLNVTMAAANNINLLPDTYIQAGANYLAKIEDCNIVLKTSIRNNAFKNNVHLKIDLDKKMNNDLFTKIVVAPNPTSDKLYIKTDEKIKLVTIFDIIGRKMEAQLAGNVIDVRDLEAGTYIINIETAKGRSTEKFIKK